MAYGTAITRTGITQGRSELIAELEPYGLIEVERKGGGRSAMSLFTSPRRDPLSERCCWMHPKIWSSNKQGRID
ncbi:MAG: hypothetical protein ACXV5T_06235 [Halobacteriota archaeon]